MHEALTRAQQSPHAPRLLPRPSVGPALVDALLFPSRPKVQEGGIELKDAAVPGIRFDPCCPKQDSKLRRVGLQLEADEDQVVALLIIHIPLQGELASRILRRDQLRHGSASPLHDVACSPNQHMRVRMLCDEIRPIHD